MIQVAIVGVGNCASSLIQGVSYYKKKPNSYGLINKQIRGIVPSDIDFVLAFDVDKKKVGLPLKKAIFAGNNNTIVIDDELDIADCFVYKAPILDGLGESYRKKIIISEAIEQDIDEALSQFKPDILINYLPVGSDKASRFWAQKCIEHKICFLNAIPSFIVSDSMWASKFEDAGVPCAGDDVKSQIGATIIHRALARVFTKRGAYINNTYQLNFGGNMDFFNMLDADRLKSKKISKLSSVKHEIPETNDIHISPTDYIQFLKDQKIAYINISGRAFGGAPVEIECKLKVWDSPNSAAVVVDLIRFLYVAKKENIGGPIKVCPYYFKSPPENLSDEDAEKIAQDIAKKIMTK